MSKTDDEFNREATPLLAQQVDGEWTHPGVMVGGAKVLVYAENGKLVISADFDTVTSPPFELFGLDGYVPVVVRMNGETVWQATAGTTAQPQAAESGTYTVVLRINVPEGTPAQHVRNTVDYFADAERSIEGWSATVESVTEAPAENALDADELRALVTSAAELWDNIDRERANDYLSTMQVAALDKALRLYHAELGGETVADERGRCEFCGRKDVTLVAALASDTDQRVCLACHTDPRVTTISLIALADVTPVYTITHADLVESAGRELTEDEVTAIVGHVGDNEMVREVVDDAVYVALGHTDDAEEDQ
jgi:hypothetical protein